MVVSCGIGLAQLNRFVEDRSSITISGLAVTIPLGEGQLLLVALGKPIAALCVVLGMTTLLMGTFRYYYVQHMLEKGKYPVAGVATMVAVAFFLSLAVIYLVLAVEVL